MVDCSARTLGVALVLSLCAGCRLEGRSARAQHFLSELTPLTLGEPLSEARRAVPGLRVRHPDDRWVQSVAPESGGPVLAGVTVSPPPGIGEEASPSAHVESVQFVLTDEQAARVETRVKRLLGSPTTVTCAGRSIAETDSVAVWSRDIRGGVLIAFPVRRAEGERHAARVVVYNAGWDPRRALSGFGVMSCPE